MIFVLSGFASFRPTGASFLIPIFFSTNSNDTFTHDLSDAGAIEQFRRIDVSNYHIDWRASETMREVGGPGIFAVRFKDGRLLAGSFEELSDAVRTVDLRVHGSPFFNVDAYAFLGDLSARSEAIEAAAQLFGDNDMARAWANREKLVRSTRLDRNFSFAAEGSGISTEIEDVTEGLLHQVVEGAAVDSASSRYAFLAIGKRSKQVAMGLNRRAGSDPGLETDLIMLCDANGDDIGRCRNILASPPPSHRIRIVVVYRTEMGIPDIGIGALLLPGVASVTIIADNSIPTGDTDRRPRLGEIVLELLNFFETVPQREMSTHSEITLFSTATARGGAKDLPLAFRRALVASANPWIALERAGRVAVLGSSVGSPEALDTQLIERRLAEFFGSDETDTRNVSWQWKKKNFLVGASIPARVSLLISEFNHVFSHLRTGDLEAAMLICRASGYVVETEQKWRKVESFVARRGGRYAQMRIRNSRGLGPDFYLVETRANQRELLRTPGADKWPLLYSDLVHLVRYNNATAADLVCAFALEQRHWKAAFGRLLSDLLLGQLQHTSYVRLFDARAHSSRVSAVQATVSSFRRAGTVSAYFSGRLDVTARMYDESGRELFSPDETFVLDFEIALDVRGVVKTRLIPDFR